MHSYSLPYTEQEGTLAAFHQQEQNAVAFGDGLQVAQVAHEDAIDRRNDVADPQVALGSTAAFFDGRDDHAALTRGTGGCKTHPGKSGMNICAREQLVLDTPELPRRFGPIDAYEGENAISRNSVSSPSRIRMFRW